MYITESTISIVFDASAARNICLNQYIYSVFERFCMHALLQTSRIIVLLAISIDCLTKFWHQKSTLENRFECRNAPRCFIYRYFGALGSSQGAFWVKNGICEKRKTWTSESRQSAQMLIYEASERFFKLESEKENDPDNHPKAFFVQQPTRFSNAHKPV